MGGEFDEEGGSETEVASSGGQGSGGQEVKPAPETVTLSSGALVGLVGGGRCVELSATPGTPEEEAQLTRWIAQYGVCPEPGEPAGNAGGGGYGFADLEAEATDVWLQLGLATPQPVIQPGWMVVGKPSYLEPRTSLAPLDTSTDTPAGLLELRARSHYRVDWGDERDPGWRTYDIEGGPWPDGRITHTYQYAGEYDVLVEQVWEAEWRVDGGDWHAIPLVRQRAGQIDDFNVIEVQAVRQR